MTTLARSLAEMSLRLVALVVGIAALAFLLLRVVPGDVVDLIAIEGGFDRTQMDRLRAELGIDRPLLVQFGEWVARALAGDLGSSLRFGRPIADMIWAAAPATLALAAAGFSFGIALGAGLALAALAFPRSPARALVEALNLWSIAVPTFCVGLVLILIVVLWLRWMPLLGNMALPSVVIGLDIAGQIAKPLYEDMRAQTEAPYVRAAYAKGLSRFAVVTRHILPNAATTLLALSGLILGGLVGGTVTMELLFGLNGLGKLAFDSVIGRDYPLTQAIVVVLAASTAVVNAGMLAAARLIDPRVAARFERLGAP